MSVAIQNKRLSVPYITTGKGQRKLACLTAYSAPFARLMDPHLDLILVGDSTAMVAYGLPDTLSITVEQMAFHAAAVVRSTQHACVIMDMPFGSYQESPEQAFRNSARAMALSA